MAMLWSSIGRVRHFSVAVAVLSGFYLCCVAGVVVVAEDEPWYVDVGLKRDADALLAFKEGLQDASGALRVWNYLQSPCAWPGVKCAAGRVVAVEVPSAMLRGSMSFKLGELEFLEVLDLSGNELSGSIPDAICDCRHLASLDVGGNRLEGAIPRGMLSLLPDLVEFVAADNKLTGALDGLIELRLAPENVPCAVLERLDLGRNGLTGELPRSLSSCSQLVEVRLESNYLVGGVPREYGALRNLETLHLQNNILDRPLPEELAGCTKLRALNVADNFITGEIPSEYVELRQLRDFDVARNRLTGRIPHGRWARRGSAFRGNDGLCGPPLELCRDHGSDGSRLSLVHEVFSRGVDALRSCARTLESGFGGSGSRRTPLRRSLLSRSSRRWSTGARWGLGIAAGIVTGVAAATVVALFTRAVLLRLHRVDPNETSIVFNKAIAPNMLAFLDKDDALEGCRVLGRGGNGTVYQVPLRDDLVVAIKCVRKSTPDDPKLSDPQESERELYDAKQIRAELATLGFIRHRNLVQLLAYICTSDSHMLVYEYMSGGSLQDALNRMAAGTLALSWPERHRILCGVAQGLAYLHSESLGSAIVHRDMKPANILLDENFEAKLGDFGLAAIVPLKATHATTAMVAGTIGFIAPEYHQTMRYSQKSDVFAFGVVIAQLVTARNPTDEFVVENGGSIGLWLERALRTNSGVGAIDPALQGSGYESEILLAMKIAVFCTNFDPQQRPKSTEVLKMLVQIRNPDRAPIEAADGNLSADSDTPIMSVSSGPLRFVGSETTTANSSSFGSY